MTFLCELPQKDVDKQIICIQGAFQILYIWIFFQERPTIHIINISIICTDLMHLACLSWFVGYCIFSALIKGEISLKPQIHPSSSNMNITKGRKIVNVSFNISYIFNAWCYRILSLQLHIMLIKLMNWY